MIGDRKIWHSILWPGFVWANSATVFSVNHLFIAFLEWLKYLSVNSKF